MKTQTLLVLFFIFGFIIGETGGIVGSWLGRSKWGGLRNDELAQIVECLPSDSNLWLSADQALEARKGH